MLWTFLGHHRSDTLHCGAHCNLAALWVTAFCLHVKCIEAAALGLNVVHTGTEATYADLGHFSRPAIRVSAEFCSVLIHMYAFHAVVSCSLLLLSVAVHACVPFCSLSGCSEQKIVCCQPSRLLSDLFLGLLSFCRLAFWQYATLC